MVRRRAMISCGVVALTALVSSLGPTESARAQRLSEFRSLSVLPEDDLSPTPAFSGAELSGDDASRAMRDENPDAGQESAANEVDPLAPEIVATKPKSSAASPFGGKSPMGVSTFWSPAQNVRGGGDLSFSGQTANLGFPISVVEGHGAWIAIANFSRLEIATSAVLPRSALAIPDELWAVQAGAMHFRDLGEGWTAGGMLTVGSAGDEPFEHGRDLTFTALGFLNVPSHDRNEWRFALMYSPTSQLPFPLPGVAYLWRPSEAWDISIGVPASVTYRPTENWTLSANWRPLTQFDLTATREIGAGWRASGGYLSKTETYWLAERSDDDDRLYLFDQRLFVGVGRDLWKNLRLEVSGAYLFDRRIFQAESFTGSRADGFGIEPGFLGTVQLVLAR